MSSYQLGQLVGASIPTLILFVVLLKQLGARSVVPYLVAVALGGISLGGLLLWDALKSRSDSSPATVVKLESGFRESCQRSCEKAGAASAKCSQLCSCVLARAHERYPSNEQFVHWFRTSDVEQPRVRQEMTELSTSCAKQP